MASSDQERLFDGGNDLPREAGNIDDPRFDPNDDWLRKAPPELQIRAMRRWFALRYLDPRQWTPHDAGEKKFLYIEGGPYHPQQELEKRFGAVVDGAVIAELADALRDEVGDDWAPRHDDPGITS